MERVIEVAEAEVGYQAIGSASKYFSELFPRRRPMPWCVPFIEWIYQKAYGKDATMEMLHLQKGGYIWSAPSLLRFFKAKNFWHQKKAQRGWLMFVRTNNEWTNHVELVVEVKQKTLITIGGNCDGKVQKNTWKRNDVRISGYGEIVYKEGESCTE